jgi:hypothetical protein
MLASISVAKRNKHPLKASPERYVWANLIGRLGIVRTERLTDVKNNLYVTVVGIPLTHQPTDYFENNTTAAAGTNTPSQIRCLRPHRKKAFTSVARLSRTRCCLCS